MSRVSEKYFCQKLTTAVRRREQKAEEMVQRCESLCCHFDDPREPCASEHVTGFHLLATSRFFSFGEFYRSGLAIPTHCISRFYIALASAENISSLVEKFAKELCSYVQLCREARSLGTASEGSGASLSRSFVVPPLDCQKYYLVLGAQLPLR